jgi:hypothetical protein
MQDRSDEETKLLKASLEAVDNYHLALGALSRIALSGIAVTYNANFRLALSDSRAAWKEMRKAQTALENFRKWKNSAGFSDAPNSQAECEATAHQDASQRALAASTVCHCMFSGASAPPWCSDRT